MKVLDALETLAEAQSDLGRRVQALSERQAVMMAQATIVAGVAASVVAALLHWLFERRP